MGKEFVVPGHRCFWWSTVSPLGPAAIDCLYNLFCCEDGRAAESEVWGAFVVKYLQNDVAILPSLVTYILFKVISRFEGTRDFIPGILAICLKWGLVSYVRWQDSTSLLHFCLLLSAIVSVFYRSRVRFIGLLWCWCLASSHCCMGI